MDKLLSHIAIRYKLAIAFLLILVLAGIGGALGVRTVAAVGRLAVNLYDKPLQAVDFGRGAQGDFREVVQSQRLASHPDGAVATRAVADYRRARKALDADLGVAVRRAASAGMRDKINRIRQLLADWDNLVPAAVPAVPRDARIDRLAQDIQDQIDLAVENAKADGFDFIQNARAEAADAEDATLAFSVVIVVVGALIALILGRNISRPLKQAVTVAENIAGGELSTSVTSDRRDEAGKLLRAMEVMRAQLVKRAEVDRRLIELEKERRLNLGRYLPPQIAEYLADTSTEAIRAGDRHDVAVLFTDIRGFTRRSEAMDPISVNRFLGEFRALVTAAADQCGGVVDKFIGDAVMVVFGVPQPKPDAARRALDCARMLTAALGAWNMSRLASGEDEVKFGIGIHHGPAFCGAVGDSMRLEYTVLGDTVNVAARLEEECKSTGVPLIVSEAVFAAAGETPDAKSWLALPPRRLRGRSGEIALFAWRSQDETAAA